MGAVGARTSAPARAWADGGEVPTTAAVPARTGKRIGVRPGMTIAYVGSVLFVLLYCSRPYEWIGGIHFIPFAKVAAIIALAGFLPALIMKPAKVFPALAEMKYLVLLFLQLVAAVPFSIWMGGSIEVVFEEFSKVVLISLCAAVAVNTVPRLRRMLLVQTFPVAIMILVSASGLGKVLYDTQGRERMRGLVGGVFENPNDYAFAIALVFPIAVMFMLRSKNPVGKLFWGATSLSSVYVVFQTLSRGGLLALAVAMGMILWEYGVRQKRYALILVSVLAVVGLMAAAPDRFLTRIQSIVDFTKDETGSGWARRALLERSINIALAHPVFGVGPGNFQTFTSDWHGAHNTYTQLASEAGLLAGIFFICLLGKAIRDARRIKWQATDPELRAQASALYASLACYAVGAFFADTGYHFFPYLFLGYAGALSQIGLRESHGASLPAKAGNGKHGRLRSKELPTTV